MASILSKAYKWVKAPLIVSAPMFPMARAPLAIKVSESGGLGFISGMLNVADLEQTLKHALQLHHETTPPIPCDEGILPIGVGFLSFGNDLKAVLPSIKQYVPAAVWLFAPRHGVSDYLQWIEQIREVTEGRTKLWVQTGSAAEALEIAKTCNPDVLVIQGADAGGHGLKLSAGLISVVPETNDMLEAEGIHGIPLVAAGGIADGRGVAAALTLGASGAVMGTRFLACEEVEIAKGYRDSILSVKDGASSTIRTEVYDELKGPNKWPSPYDGRAIINKSYTDAKAGLPIEENRKLFAEAVKLEDEGYGPEGRMIMWAGSGVGLVKEVLPASVIVEQAREGAKKVLQLSLVC